MKSNASLLKQVGDGLADLGVRDHQVDPATTAKSVMTTDNMKTGDFMDRKQVHALVDLTVSLSAWLAATSTKVVDQRAGELPRINLTEPVTEGVSENQGATITTLPTTDRINYACKKFQSTIFITWEDIREARASGTADFGEVVRRVFAKALGNDMARVFMRGDVSLDASTRLNRLLRTIDGWLVQARASAIRNTTTRGSDWAVGLYPYMLSQMPEEYAEDPDLRFLESRMTDLSYEDYLAGLDGSDLRDEAQTQSPNRRRHGRLGIPALIIPQIPSTQGFDTLDGSAAAPDAVVDDGDGTMTITVDTVLGGYAAAKAGRKVKVTKTSNGQSETLTVKDLAGALKVETAGSLGQSTISTTAGDYSVDVADCTSSMLTNPLNLLGVICDQVRAYREFQQAHERWRIDVFWEGDAKIYNENALVLQDGVNPTRFAFGS